MVILKKEIEIGDKKVWILGIAHMSTNFSKGLDKYLENADLVAIEGEDYRSYSLQGIDLEEIYAFLGEEGYKIVKKIPIAKLELSLEKDLKEIFNMILFSFPILIPSVVICSYLFNIFQNDFSDICQASSLYLGILMSLGGILISNYEYGYPKIPNFLYKVIENLEKAFLKVSSCIFRRRFERDYIMSYGIYNLVRYARFKRIVAVLGAAHAYNISKLLEKDIHELKKKAHGIKTRFCNIYLFDPETLKPIGAIPLYL